MEQKVGFTPTYLFSLTSPVCLMLTAYFQSFWCHIIDLLLHNSLVVTTGFHTCIYGSRPLHALRRLSYVTVCHIVESNHSCTSKGHQSSSMQHKTSDTAEVPVYNMCASTPKQLHCCFGTLSTRRGMCSTFPITILFKGWLLLSLPSYYIIQRQSLKDIRFR